MSRGINKVILIGNCCDNPEAKFMPSGGAVTNISIATNESWKDKNTGKLQERAEFHRVVFFNRLAEIAAQYLRKGAKVFVEGKLRTRKWTDQQGVDRYTTEIVAEQMQMLDGRQEGQQGAGGGYGHQQPQKAYQQPQQQPQQHNAPAAQQSNQQTAPPPAFDDFEYDLPF